MTGTDDLERTFGHRFSRTDLVEEAVTHSSALNEAIGRGRSGNDRLAHLGDAVIELAVRDALYRRNPRGPAELSKEADQYISGENLTRVAGRLGLERVLIGSRGLDVTVSGVLGELYEALVGAMYLERGFEKASQLVVEHLLGDAN